MPVEIHLLAVEAAFHLQTVESLTELQELRPPPLTVQTLLTDVLKGEGKTAEIQGKTLKKPLNSPYPWSQELNVSYTKLVN